MVRGIGSIPWWLYRDTSIYSVQERAIIGGGLHTTVVEYSGLRKIIVYIQDLRYLYSVYGVP